MRRYSPRRLWLSISSLAAAVILAAAAGMLLWGSAYVHNTVQGQLAPSRSSSPRLARLRTPRPAPRSRPA